MNYAAVLAGGSGLRMGGDLPKQFLEIGGRPILIRSIDAFAGSSRIDRIFVAVSEDYVDYTKSLIEKFIEFEDIEVVIGGKNRNETLFNVLKKIENISKDDIILTHDAVRPFIDNRIIDENIEAAKQYGACNTVIPAVDTVLRSSDGRFIENVPPRSEIFHAQTPQSFKVSELYKLYSSMTDKEFESYTDACTVFIENGEKVFMVTGSRDNIKLTYPEDMEKAEIIIKIREAEK